MKKTLLGTLLTTSMFMALLNSSYAERPLIKIDGSSTVFPITEAVAEEFQTKKRGKVMVTVGISGTGGGFKKFIRSEIDIVNASRAIKPKEYKLCKQEGIEFIELPIAYDGLAIMVNPQNDWVDSLTVSELKKIWRSQAEGKVMKWSQIRQGWPDKEFRLFGPGVDSGTFDYFTKVINGKEGASRGDFTASEDDNVLVQGIANDIHGLGFFGFAYYEHNKDKLKLVPIDDEKGEDGPVYPTVKTINNETYKPLSRAIFIYVNKKAATKNEVNEFVQFYLKNAPELTTEVGYIPLPTYIYKNTLNRFKKRVIGSVFLNEDDLVID
jgi:phosphate transport system substrate-binding protein